MAVAKSPPHVGKALRKITRAAKAGKLVELNKKDRRPLRPGQRTRTRTRKPRIVTTYSEAPDLQNRADKIIGAGAFRMRALAQAKILYLFTSAERVTGCLDGTVRAGRYPRLFRYKPALKYEFLALVSKPRWERGSDEDRTRITYHALRHMGSDTAGRWRTDPHDIEGFYTEVELFGLRTPEVKRIAEQLDLFQHRPMKADEKT